MEELFLKALLWIDNIAPQDDYLDLLHEIYLQPENKDNQDFLELEDCTNNKAETYHVFFRIIHSEQSTWNEDLFNKLVTELQIPLKWYADSDIAVSHSAPNGTIRCKMEATPLSYQTQIRTELSSPKPTRRCVAGFTARSDLLDRLCGVAS